MDMIISPILGWIPTCVIDPIRVRFRMLRNLEDNVEALRQRTDFLAGRRDSQREKVEEEKKQRGVEASKEANIWFREVNNALSKANNLRAEYDERRRIGSCQRHCFCWSGYQLSKRASKLRQVVDELYNADLKSSWTAASSISKKGKKLDTVSIEGQTTTEKLKHEIINAVLDDKYVVVGLYGMGGIGKTTLLRHVNEHFRKTEHFDSVIFTRVSATPNFVEIRKQIAQCFDLFPEKDQDDDELKENLSRHFERSKYMLILDDMWERPVDLNEICNIPTPKKANGCKILMASRSSSVISRFATRLAEKDSLRSIPVNKLSEDDAWTLFVQKVGADITSKPEIEHLAKEVLRKCDGLPLAIVVIGSTMSNEEAEEEWKYAAAHELEQHSVSNLGGIEEEVFLKLVFSFEKLKPIEQSLFLYCCLLPGDWNFGKDELLDFAIGEETLWDEKNNKLEDMRIIVNVLVRKLRKSSMLEDGEYNETMKMHDVMRKLGLWITSSNYQYSNKYIVKGDARITEAPDASEWCKATKISLIENEKLETLPELPDQCPLLHTLLLEGCISIKEIPQMHFLEHLSALRILDLSETGIENLPPSISHLFKLRLLRLNGCRSLQNLGPEIGMLTQLISLDLGGCRSLKMLPVEMKKLSNLRHLDISDAEKLKKIPHEVLQNLEELNTVGSRLKWTADSIMRFSQLPRLTSISIELVEAKVSSGWLKPLAKRIHGLHLWNCDIDTLALLELLEDSPKLDIFVIFESREGLTHVPNCGYGSLIVQDCPNLKILLIVEEEEESNNIIAFERLHSLDLVRLDQFETLCSGVPQQPGCFSNLQEIEIKGCLNLKVLFTNVVIRLLKKLSHLDVLECPQLVSLIVSDEEEEEKDLESIVNAFPSLKRMRLCELSELTSICSNHRHLDLMKWPSLSTNRGAFVYLCPKLRRPPFGTQRADILLNDVNSKMIKSYLDYKREEEEEENDVKEEGLISS